MRLVHTSDWHLGHTLHDRDRGAEHAAFVEWLLGQLSLEKPELLLIAGDVFDVANPAASAVAAWYRFLLAAHVACPDLTIVVIAGNHDSGTRLDAPKELLGHFRVHIVGAVPRRADGTTDSGAMLVPIVDAAGALLARVAAVPFLRPSDLVGGEDPDRWVEAIRAVYADVFALAPDDGVPLLAMGHSYMVGGQVSDLSERKILGGNLHALPDDIFPERVRYAALGHLHLAQKVGKRSTVRYSGSPLPLALDERDYPHQICVVDVDGTALEIRHSRTPRTIPCPRIPEKGSVSLAEAVMRLRAWASDEPGWIEVCVRFDAADINIRAQLEEAVEGKVARVLRITTEGGGAGGQLGDLEQAADLSQLSEEDVFKRRWESHAGAEPVPDDLMVLFHECLDAAKQEAR